MSHFEKTGRKGHGCCCGTITMFLVCAVILALLVFTTNIFDGLKNKVMTYFYPQDYSQYVSTYAKEYDVDEALVYAVIRTESGFDSDAKSSVGAMGLMQMMPSTFESTQKMLDGKITHKEAELYDPQVSIKYGVYYLSFLLDHYDGAEKLAVAAYNGGYANVDSWLEDARYSKDGMTLSDIPFAETKKYVERVEDAKSVYESLYYDNK